MSCGDSNNSVYEQSYNENFDKLISGLDHEPDRCDTLYTEMYIALKEIGRDDACGDIVLDRVEKLMELDDIPENQRHYLEAANIVYGSRNDYTSARKTMLRSFNTYPSDSFERLSSFACYYTLLDENPDSASFYIERTRNVILPLRESNDPRERLDSCIGLTTLLILENNDEEAKNLLSRFINTENNANNIEVAKDYLQNFDSFKKCLLETKSISLR